MKAFDPELQELIDTGEAVWWLSFVDVDKVEPDYDQQQPGGPGFLGVALVLGPTEFLEAVRQSHRLRINPGGEVQGSLIPRALLPGKYINVFVPAADMDKLAQDIHDYAHSNPRVEIVEETTETTDESD